MDSDASIQVRGLRVIRGTKLVLPDLSVDVRRGQVTGLLGPSGCGKSTLMRAIVGVQRVRAGEVMVLGHPAGSRRLRDQVGYVTQAPSTYGDLTVRENLRYFGRVLGVADARIDSVLKTVGLTEVADQVVDRLSGGQRARVSLATALVNEPQVLVLDEPTVGLDPVLRRELWDTFDGLAAGGTTILVSSHVMDEAERCSSLILMRDGDVLASGSPRELLARTDTRDMESAFLALVHAEESPA